MAWAQASTAVEFVIDVVIDMRQEISAGRFDPARDQVGVRGALAPLRWDQSLIASAAAQPGLYRLRIAVDPSTLNGQALAHKFKVESPGQPNAGWETGANRALLLGTAPTANLQRVFGTDPDRPPPQRTGHIERLAPLPSAHVSPREVQVWLPPGYADDPQRRFPVLYLHDGQNMFDNLGAGAEWQADEHAQRGVLARTLVPMILVAVASNEDRIQDYTPWPRRQIGGPDGGQTAGPSVGGGAAAYGRYLVEELKPMIDRRYRTQPGREHTAVGGSSLGGLVTMWLLLQHGDTYGAGLVVSPSVWWADRAILAAVEGSKDTAGAKPARPAPRIWLDMGGAEGERAVIDARRLRDALQARGWPAQYLEVPQAQHDEAAWAARFEGMLRFLYAAPR